MYKNLSLKRHWKISNSDIYIFETENILKLTAEKNVITKQYSEALSKLTSQKKQNEFIATRIIHHFVFNHSEIIRYNNSAPFFCDSTSISISHSNNLIAIAYSKAHRIGIDLEKESTRIKKIAHKILHPDESKYLEELSLVDKHIYLNKIWTVKEACYKACYTNSYSFKTYKTEQLFDENASCTIIETKENFKLYFKRLEKFYFCLAILS